MVVGECPAARLDVVRAALSGGAGPAAVNELLEDLSSEELLGAILQPGRALAALCAPGTWANNGVGCIPIAFVLHPFASPR